MKYMYKNIYKIYKCVVDLIVTLFVYIYEYEFLMSNIFNLYFHIVAGIEIC